ncbi:rCG59975 [Rattus norvegicus]|uniref:RCG59975 n=1 Tax=Rattus norvegicus TaxID=10116 RepID=A6HTB7_RAT|nr:rCG59975 [Rattus norvegicus]
MKYYCTGGRHRFGCLDIRFPLCWLACDEDAGARELRACTTGCKVGTRAAWRSTEVWRAGGDAPISTGQKGAAPALACRPGGRNADLPVPSSRPQGSDR